MFFQKNYFVISVLFTSLVTLTACQDNANQTARAEADKNQSIQEKEHQHNNHKDHTHHHHDIGMEQTEFQKAYMQGMVRMHDDMMDFMTANNADVAFAKGMLPHHEGAVDMAEVQLKYGTDETMRKLAQEIINAQESEINLMKKWLKEHPDTEKQDNIEEVKNAYHQGMQAMHDDMMSGIHSDSADVAFAKGMLPHHKGAVDMAKVQLKYGKDKTMRQLAEDIIKTQESEIELMQRWIAEHS